MVLGQQAFPSAHLTDADSLRLRDLLLSEISLAGMASPPAAVRELLETFLRQLTLPRLIHFFDLVLPQLVPRWEASAGQARSRLECHILRLCEDAWNNRHFANSVRFSFRLQFLSHAGICHTAVHWGNNEVLLFTGPNHIGLVDTSEFKSSSALETHRKNVQLGLRIGQAALIVFEVRGVVQKAVWILMHNKLSTTKGGADPATKNPFWKFVVPVISHFAWLPESIAHSRTLPCYGGRSLALLSS